MSVVTNGHTSQPGDKTAQEHNYGNPPPLGNPIFGAMVGVAPPPPQDPPMRNYRPNSLSQPFNLVERFKTGMPSLGYGLLLGSPYLARIIGAGGYDWVMIDWEHTPMSESGCNLHGIEDSCVPVADRLTRRHPGSDRADPMGAVRLRGPDSVGCPVSSMYEVCRRR